MPLPLSAKAGKYVRFIDNLFATSQFEGVRFTVAPFLGVVIFQRTSPNHAPR